MFHQWLEAFWIWLWSRPFPTAKSELCLKQLSLVHPLIWKPATRLLPLSVVVTRRSSKDRFQFVCMYDIALTKFSLEWSSKSGTVSKQNVIKFHSLSTNVWCSLKRIICLASPEICSGWKVLNFFQFRRNSCFLILLCKHGISCSAKCYRDGILYRGFNLATIALYPGFSMVL